MSIFYFFIGIAIGGLIFWLIILNKKIQQINIDIKNEINQALKNYSAQNNELFFSKLEYQKQDFKNLLSGLENQLKSYYNLVNDIFEKNQHYNLRITEQIKLLNDLQKQVQQQTDNLVNALKNPQIRGKWAEIQLKNIIEKSGLTQYIDYETQKTFYLKDKRLVPDFIINLPNNKKIIIDSKFSLDNYLKATETENQNEKERLLKEFAKNIEKQIRNLSLKNYSEIQASVEFVVLYMSIENALTEALKIKPDLFDKAIENKIIIATPFTLFPLLHLISTEWKNFTLSQNTKKILETIKNLNKSMSSFEKNFEDLGKKLNQIQNLYLNLEKIYQFEIKPTIDSFTELEVKNNNR